MWLVRENRVCKFAFLVEIQLIMVFVLFSPQLGWQYVHDRCQVRVGQRWREEMRRERRETSRQRYDAQRFARRRRRRRHYARFNDLDVIDE